MAERGVSTWRVGVVKTAIGTIVLNAAPGLLIVRIQHAGIELEFTSQIQPFDVAFMAAKTIREVNSGIPREYAVSHVAMAMATHKLKDLLQAGIDLLAEKKASALAHGADYRWRVLHRQLDDIPRTVDALVNAMGDWAKEDTRAYAECAIQGIRVKYEEAMKGVGAYWFRRPPWSDRLDRIDQPW